MHYRKPRVDGNFGDVVAVTDNAANEKKAFEILGWPRLPCNGQNLNLVVKAGLKEVSKVVAKARSIVTMGMLESKQKLLLKEECHGHKLPTDTPTRWNSTFEMLVRVVEQTAAIRAVADDPRCPGGQDLKRKLLTMNEQLLIQSFITILKQCGRWQHCIGLQSWETPMSEPATTCHLARETIIRQLKQ